MRSKLVAFFIGAAMTAIPVSVILLALLVESLGWGAVLMLIWCSVSLGLMYYGLEALW